MKNKFLKIALFTAFLLVGSTITTSVCAQVNLEKWAEKCGNTEGVDYSVISRKDKVTKKPISIMISISFKDNPTLMSALQDAIAKDKKDAVEIIESKKGGVLKPEIYRFYDETTKQDTNYIFSESKDGTLSVVITTRNATVVKINRK